MWRFFLQKQLFYLPLEVLEGSACKHIFIKLQLSFLVCSALQAHSALGHFLVRRSHRQRSPEHHDGIFYMKRSYFNVPDDYFNHPRALKSSNMIQQICQMSSLSCGLRAARDRHLSAGVQKADSHISNGAPASVALQDEVPWISFSLCSRRPDLRHNRHLLI